MKPLIRWTIGDISNKSSFEVLELSIKLFKNIFKEFDYIVCYNCEDEEKINSIEYIAKKLNVETFNQRENNLTFELNKFNSFWKYCPFRLRPEVHEIIIDNDIVIFQRIKKIEEFLNSTKVLICEDKYRFFGKYDYMHEKGVALNSGLIGFPPYYSIEKELKDHLIDKELNYDDEQGLVMGILNKEQTIKISTEEISVLHFNKYYNGKQYQDYSNFYFYGKQGFHFVGINRRKSHLGWELYNKLYNIKFL